VNDTIRIGKEKVNAAALEMLGLQSLGDTYGDQKPFSGISMLVCVTPTPETGVFLLTLQKLGAKIAACSDNAFASDDDVVAYIRSEGITIYAQSNMSSDEYFGSMEKAISDVKDEKLLHIIDDGCDITQYIAEHHPSLFSKTRLITEQTTCGINFLKRLFADKKVNAPAININHCFTKQWFDNNIGIQQSLIHALTTSGISIPGKNITVFGYGPIGQGAAHALRSSGAMVNIVEPNIIALMQAEMAGYKPMSVQEALQTSDLCLTATGCVDTISAGMINKHARSGITLGNVGHGTSEYPVAYLEAEAKKSPLNEYLDIFTLKDGRAVNSLCKGALVNFIAGSGNMPRVMGITFTLTILAHLRAARSHERMAVGLHSLSRSLEVESAKRNFPHLVDILYPLQDYQIEYLVQE
jgi:adenosylhomocysteinase